MSVATQQRAQQQKLFAPLPQPPVVVGPYSVCFADTFEECIVLDARAGSDSAPCIATYAADGDEHSRHMYRFMLALRQQLRGVGS